MKYLFETISLLFFGYSLNASAQTIDSIAISTNGSWIIEHSETTYGWDYETETYGFTTVSSYFYYRSGGDTIIDGNVYTNLLKTSINRNSDGSYSGSSGEYPYLAYRNDNERRAYRILYHADDTTEQLWYDFNLDVGETLWNPSFYFGPSLEVEDTSTHVFCDEVYKKFVFPWHFEMYQGVGSKTNFLHDYEDEYIGDILLHFCNNAYPFHAVAGISEIESTNSNQKELLGVYDLLGRPSEIIPNVLLIYLYSDGSSEKKVILE
ncbi:MAG: hypothetical protein MK078_01640 [Crocinitomicaceae bacterium]|nr:hypothetical protein [Crocinitomicaceae bacterium]